MLGDFLFVIRGVFIVEEARRLERRVDEIGAVEQGVDLWVRRVTGKSILRQPIPGFHKCRHWRPADRDRPSTAIQLIRVGDGLGEFQVGGIDVSPRSAKRSLAAATSRSLTRLPKAMSVVLDRQGHGHARHPSTASSNSSKAPSGCRRPRRFLSPPISRSSFRMLIQLLVQIDLETIDVRQVLLDHVDTVDDRFDDVD